jgi:chromosomal replication initiator protein
MKEESRAMPPGKATEAQAVVAGQKDAWDRIKRLLKNRIAPQAFTTWLEPTIFSHQNDGMLFVSVPSATWKDWIAEHYSNEIQEAAAALEPPVNEVRFLAEHAMESAETSAAPATVALPPRVDASRRDSPLDPRYRFDKFVEGTSNQLALAAAKRVAADPGGSYNPLFLYGSVGLGKTHLMQAIGHELRHRMPHWRVCYVSAERFMNEMIQSLKEDSMASFREWIRNVDVLLVDDVQMLARGERTQEEFFHTFNTLYEFRKQIVLTSDCPPKTIAIEERLRSRFEWGLIADIQPPDKETRQAILMKKAEVDGCHLPEGVAKYIAEHVKSNVRALEGCLVRLMAHCSITNTPITEEVAARVLKNQFAGEQQEVTLDAIQKLVADHFGIRIQELKAKNNSKRVVFPRQVAMWMARELTESSLPEIARAFGGKHHTTVLHSVEKIARKKRTDVNFNKELSLLMSSFQ